MTYQLINSEVVRRIDDDGVSRLSGSVNDPQYQDWLAAGNTPLPADPPPPVNPLDAAEAHIAAHFSTPRLLQMKVWWDTFPPEDVPKLASVFDWTTAVTIAAAQGQITFPEPPHSFEELLVEAMQFLGIPPSPEPEPDPIEGP